jgi:hypothetical protein
MPEGRGTAFGPCEKIDASPKLTSEKIQAFQSKAKSIFEGVISYRVSKVGDIDA